MATPADAPAEKAFAVLIEACRFLIARKTPTTIAPQVRWRRAGNDLKELDRFLAVLLAACQASEPQGLYGAPDSVFARMGLAVEMPRLRAIARLRAAACDLPQGALSHRLRRDLAVASAGHGIDEAGIDDAAIAAIARFYVSIAERLGAAGRNLAAPD